MTIPQSGHVILTVCDEDKKALMPLAKELRNLGFVIHATQGTLKALQEAGIEASFVEKLRASRPNIVDFLRTSPVQMVVNTISGHVAGKDSVDIRTEAIRRGITLITTMAGFNAAVTGIKAMNDNSWRIAPLQDYHNLSDEV
jgi:carbamoyl-phosphate synthase large subunit